MQSAKLIFSVHLEETLLVYFERFNLQESNKFMVVYRNIYRVIQEECARLRESVPYVKVYR